MACADLVTASGIRARSAPTSVGLKVQLHAARSTSTSGLVECELVDERTSVSLIFEDVAVLRTARGVSGKRCRFELSKTSSSSLCLLRALCVQSGCIGLILPASS